jgi:hypothetical protein
MQSHEVAQVEAQRFIVSPFTYVVEGNVEAMIAGGACGAFLGDEGKILFDPRQARDQLRDTLLHEGIHAAFAQTNIKATTFKDAAGDGDVDKEEERVVASLSPRILSIVRDNPWLVDLMLEGTGWHVERDLIP